MQGEIVKIINVIDIHERVLILALPAPHNTFYHYVKIQIYF